MDSREEGKNVRNPDAYFTEKKDYRVRKDFTGRIAPR